nr:acyltransferase [Sphingomonas ginkgonis]
MTPVRTRYHYVDLLRGLAALAVLVTHYRWFYARFPADWRDDVSLPFSRYLWPIYQHGGWAVEVFWALSGFVFAVAYGSLGRTLSPREFWIHRISRLYPLHLVTLIVVALLQSMSFARFGHALIYPNNDLKHLVLQLLFASNWFTQTPSFNAPIWSVSVEVLVYFFFLAFMLRWGPSRTVAAVLAVLSIAFFKLTGSMLGLCSGLFFLGAIIGFSRDRLAVAPVLAALLAAAAGLYFSVDIVIFCVGAPALVAGFALLDQRAPSFPRPLRLIGAITYSVYLWHMPILISFRLNEVIPPLWLFCAVTIAAALLSYRCIESPAQHWLRNKLLSKPVTARGPATPEERTRGAV